MKAEFDWISADGVGDDRLQDQVERLSLGCLAQHSQLLLQRMVDHPSLQTNEGLFEIRLLSGKYTP